MKKKKAKSKIIVLLCSIPLIFVLLLNLGIYLYPEHKIGHNNEVTIYDNSGKYAFTHHYYGLSKYVTLEEISPYMEKCIIASEDQRFYSHHGLDYRRIIASIFGNLTSGSIVSGASTITQQLARTIYLDNEKSIERKIKEAIIARKLEMTYSKEKILELYLNCVYFGHNIYGIDEASYYFFKKSS